MKSKELCRCLFECAVSKPAVAGLFAILMICIGFESYGQSYFYFQNKVPLTQDSSITYYTFLTLQNNGSGAARIRYVEPASGEPRLVELNLLDSADISNGIDDPQHFLVLDGEPLPVEGTHVSGIHIPRISFKKQMEGSDAFYVPDSIMYQLPDGHWLPSEMLINEQKTDAQLKNEQALVEIFFNRSHAFYNYLFGRPIYGRAPVKRKEKLYLIAVANTMDPYIGRTTKTDMSNVVNTFSRMAKDLNMDISVQKIIDNSFGKKMVELVLAKLHPSPIDIVVFYYSGHGFRYDTDTSAYPRISMRLSEKADLFENNISLESIYKTLLKKKARFTLVFSDCCNKSTPYPNRIGPGWLITRSPPGQLKPVLNTAVCNQLFFPAKPTSILIGSAEKDQLAAGNPSLGGYFTNVFAGELLGALYGPGTSVTWLGLLAGTRRKASWLSLGATCEDDRRCIQSARFDMTPKP